jgi:Flp pilus assembly pilin Flp
MYKISSFVHARRGAGLIEYVGLTAAVVITGGVVIGKFGADVSDVFDQAAYAVEEQSLINTGFVSDFADEKVIGIAKDYAGKLTFIQEDAGFRNSLGMYHFDTEGVIEDITILFENSSAEESGGELVPSESFVDVDLEVGDQIGFFLISNGYSYNSDTYQEADEYFLLDENGDPATIFSEGSLTLYASDNVTGEMHAIRSVYDTDIFYSHANPDKDYAPNADGWPHTVGYVNTDDGTITLGFEDQFSGGDMDYNDVVFEFDVGRSNAAVLDPNLDYDYEGYDGWVSELKLSETDKIEIETSN